jgi:hypothetical protein
VKDRIGFCGFVEIQRQRITTNTGENGPTPVSDHGTPSRSASSPRRGDPVATRDAEVIKMNHDEASCF